MTGGKIVDEPQQSHSPTGEVDLTKNSNVVEDGELDLTGIDDEELDKVIKRI